MSAGLSFWWCVRKTKCSDPGGLLDLPQGKSTCSTHHWTQFHKAVCSCYQLNSWGGIRKMNSTLLCPFSVPGKLSVHFQVNFQAYCMNKSEVGTFIFPSLTSGWVVFRYPPFPCMYKIHFFCHQHCFTIMFTLIYFYNSDNALNCNNYILEPGRHSVKPLCVLSSWHML